MSSASAGKFQDHYEVLGVEPRAESDAIQKAYARLAQKFHPSNEDTGDAEKFEAVNLAFEVLSDPDLRPEFDKIKGLDKDQGPPKFSGQEFFTAFVREAGLRQALLCMLYDRRRQKPFTPSLSMRNIEAALAASIGELNLVIWYLKQKNHVSMDDKSSLQITVTGMDYLDEHRPTASVVIPFIKDIALTNPQDAAIARATPAEATPAPSSTPAPAMTVAALPVEAPVTPPAAAPVPEVSSVMAILNRALARAEYAHEEAASETPSTVR